MTIYTYSERGIVDSLVYSLKDDELVKKFLILGFPELKNKNLTDINFYLEHSLSEFGSPDLIITYKLAGKKTVVFIEAKVSNGKKSWNLARQYEDYCNDKKKPKDITSNFFRQIALKKLLIQNKSIVETSGVSNGDNRVMGTKEERKLGENEIVLKLFNLIKDADKDEYLGLVPEASIPTFEEKDKDLLSDIKYITWAQIKDFAIDNKLRYLIDNFEWNKGLIYNE